VTRTTAGPALRPASGTAYVDWTVLAAVFTALVAVYQVPGWPVAGHEFAARRLRSLCLSGSR
jgi:hypothetical protein